MRFFSCLCPTWNRPQLLNEVVECFLRQDYPADKRELIILDDAGQYDTSIVPDGVKLVSIPYRFRSLGHKRNATAALISSQSEAIAVWDDDDIYLPHTLRAHDAALGKAEISVPGKVLIDNGGPLSLRNQQFLFHGGWAFTIDVLDRVGGYPCVDDGSEDQKLMGRWRACEIPIADSTESCPPYYIYRWAGSGCSHISATGKRPEASSIQTGLRIVPGWRQDYVRKAEEAHGV